MNNQTNPAETQKTQIKKQANQVTVLKSYLETPQVTSALEKILPKFLTIDKLLSVVLTEVRNIPKLLECDHESFTNCLLKCVQLGLVPGALLGQAYLIPRNIKGKMTCTLLPGYRGYVVLAERAGTSLTAQCYCENDIKYECMLGSVEQIIHIPANDNRGKVICAYAVAKKEAIDKNGTRRIVTKIDHMSMSDINRAKACSQCPDKFWKPHEHEMCRKTVAKRLGKYLDLSPEFSQLREIDNNLDNGIIIEGEYSKENDLLPNNPPNLPNNNNNNNNSPLSEAKKILNAVNNKNQQEAIFN